MVLVLSAIITVLILFNPYFVCFTVSPMINPTSLNLTVTWKYIDKEKKYMYLLCLYHVQFVIYFHLIQYCLYQDYLVCFIMYMYVQWFYIFQTK